MDKNWTKCGLNLAKTVLNCFKTGPNVRLKLDKLWARTGLNLIQMWIRTGQNVNKDRNKSSVNVDYNETIAVLNLTLD